MRRLGAIFATSCLALSVLALPARSLANPRLGLLQAEEARASVSECGRRFSTTLFLADNLSAVLDEIQGYLATVQGQELEALDGALREAALFAPSDPLKRLLLVGWTIEVRAQGLFDGLPVVEAYASQVVGIARSEGIQPEKAFDRLRSHALSDSDRPRAVQVIGAIYLEVRSALFGEPGSPMTRADFGMPDETLDRVAAFFAEGERGRAVEVQMAFLARALNPPEEFRKAVIARADALMGTAAGTAESAAGQEPPPARQMDSPSTAQPAQGANSARSLESGPTQGTSRSSGRWIAPVKSIATGIWLTFWGGTLLWDVVFGSDDPLRVPPDATPPAVVAPRAPALAQTSLAVSPERSEITRALLELLAKIAASSENQTDPEVILGIRDLFARHQDSIQPGDLVRLGRFAPRGTSDYAAEIGLEVRGWVVDRADRVSPEEALEIAKALPYASDRAEIFLAVGKAHLERLTPELLERFRDLSGADAFRFDSLERDPRFGRATAGAVGSNK